MQKELKLYRMNDHRTKREIKTRKIFINEIYEKDKQYSLVNKKCKNHKSLKLKRSKIHPAPSAQT